MGLCRTHIDFYALEFQQSLCNFAVKMSPGNVPSPLSLSSAFIHGGKSLSPNAVSCKGIDWILHRFVCPRKRKHWHPLGNGGVWDLSPFLVLLRRSRFRTLESSGSRRSPGHGTAEPGIPPRWLQRDSWFGGAALTHCEGFDSSGTWQITPAEGTQASEWPTRTLESLERILAHGFILFI